LAGVCWLCNSVRPRRIGRDGFLGDGGIVERQQSCTIWQRERGSLQLVVQGVQGALAVGQGEEPLGPDKLLVCQHAYRAGQFVLTFPTKCGMVSENATFPGDIGGRSPHAVRASNQCPQLFQPEIAGR
jgi:hypothetical protein